jgi:hypothetical protein
MIVKYDASQIKLKNIPELGKLASETSCRTYLYSFNTKLPKQNDIDQIAGGLNQKFEFPKDQFEIPEDVEILASVAIKRLEDYQAQVSILTTHPEDYWVYVFGIHTLPFKLEEIFGTVKSIQGQPREIWIY